MQSLLSDFEKTRYEEFKKFVSLHVAPSTEDWDREQDISASIISLLGTSGYLGSSIPTTFFGRGWSTTTFGLLNEAVGRSSSALADLLTVQAMVSMTLLKFGTNDQKARWLPQLAKGEIIGAFALTEPGAGSDLQSLKTELRLGAGDQLLLTGQKTWISYAQRANLFLVIGTLNEKSIACLVPLQSEGLQIEPIQGMLGFRAANLAQIRFRDVAIPAENLIGKPGMAMSYIVPFALQYGRISTACSALGLLRGCFEESIFHAPQRVIGNRTVGDLGMIRSMLAKMGTNLHAAGLLCYDACRATDEHLPDAFAKALMAKYFTSKAAASAASAAVQIKGASGCHEASSPVARYYRDAKIMEIIEGTSQIHEDLLATIFLSTGKTDAN